MYLNRETAFGLCFPSAFYHVIKHRDHRVPPFHKLVDCQGVMGDSHSQSAGECGYGDNPLVPNNHADYHIAELLGFLPLRSRSLAVPLHCGLAARALADPAMMRAVLTLGVAASSASAGGSISRRCRTHSDPRSAGGELGFIEHYLRAQRKLHSA